MFGGLSRAPTAQHHTGSRADDPSPAETGGPSGKDPQATGPCVAGATQDTELTQAWRDTRGRPGGGAGKGTPDSSHAWRWAQQGTGGSACDWAQSRADAGPAGAGARLTTALKAFPLRAWPPPGHAVGAH